MKIVIETIPHEQQRYPTCGDWYYADGGDLIIKVSELGDWRYEALIAVHELVEVLLCKYKNVTQEDVDHFDTEYEKARPKGDLSEPGDDPKAPYMVQHGIASGVERILGAGLEVNWNDYADKVEAL